MALKNSMRFRPQRPFDPLLYCQAPALYSKQISHRRLQGSESSCHANAFAKWPQKTHLFHVNSNSLLGLRTNILPCSPKTALAFFFHFQNSNVLSLGIAGEIVFLHTGVDAFSASDAATDIEGIAIDNPIQRLRIAIGCCYTICRVDLIFQWICLPNFHPWRSWGCARQA